jgi:hypothetical protein
LLVYFWAQSVPILIRPLYTWRGISPDAFAMRPLQEHGWILVIVSVLASLLRMISQSRTARQEELGRRLDLHQVRLLFAPPEDPLVRQLPQQVRVLASATWSTLLLAGMLANWLDAMLLWLFVLGLGAARSSSTRSLFSAGWAYLERVPLLVRVAVGLLILWLLSNPVLSWFLPRTGSFRPILGLAVLGMLILGLLNPPQPTGARMAKGASS